MKIELKKILAVILLLNLALFTYYFTFKSSWHIDEFFQYGHANSTQGAFMHPDIDCYYRLTPDARKFFFNRWVGNDFLHNWSTVQPNERFSYSHIFENIKVDVHPPLYFILLHTVSSFFPDVLSPWFAFIINAVCWLLCCIFLFKLAKQILDSDKFAFVVCLFWSWSAVSFEGLIFLRMYLMQTMFAVALMYETARLLKNNSPRFSLIFLYSFLGIFTHYNSLVFSFLIAAMGCLVLLFSKRWKDLYRFAAIMLASAIMLFIVFPDAWDVLFYSSRGVQIQQKSFFGVFIFVDLLLENQFSVYFRKIFSFQDLHIQELCLVLIIGNVFIYLNRTDKKWNIPFIALLIASVGFTLFICLFMPYMGKCFLRYLLPVQPFFILATCYFIWLVLESVSLKDNGKILLFVFLIAINFVFARVKDTSYFLFPADEPTAKYLKDVEGKKVFMVHYGLWPIWNHQYYLEKTKDVYFFQFPYEKGKEFCSPEVMAEIVKEPDAFVLVYKAEITKKSDVIENICHDKRLKYLYNISVGAYVYEVYQIDKDALNKL